MFESEIEDFEDFEDESPTTPGSEIRVRVLVAEDDEDLRALIATRMRREAFDVIEAGSGEEALDVLSSTSNSSSEIDLLVMDVRMPGPSGLDIARMLRAANWITPVVLMTAFPDGEVVHEARRLGLWLVAKPFALDRLGEVAIAALLAPPAPIDALGVT